MREYLDGRAMDDVAMERLRTFEAEAPLFFERDPDESTPLFGNRKD